MRCRNGKATLADATRKGNNLGATANDEMLATVGTGITILFGKLGKAVFQKDFGY